MMYCDNSRRAAVSFIERGECFYKFRRRLCRSSLIYGISASANDLRSALMAGLTRGVSNAFRCMRQLLTALKELRASQPALFRDQVSCCLSQKATDAALGLTPLSSAARASA